MGKTAAKPESKHEPKNGPSAHSLKERELYEALLLMNTVEDCLKFFTDLCTPAEIQALADRWHVAKLLQQEIPYREIYEKTGVSTATVTRVARCLTYGEGYQLILDRMPKKGKAKSYREGE